MSRVPDFWISKKTSAETINCGPHQKARRWSDYRERYYRAYRDSYLIGRLVRSARRWGDAGGLRGLGRWRLDSIHICPLYVSPRRDECERFNWVGPWMR
jgi:hypothetical protein